MEKEKYADSPFDDFDDGMSLDIGKWIKILLDHLKTVLWWTVAAFVLGCAAALVTPRRYEVTTKLAPELSSTATNRLTSLATLVGLSSNVLGTTDAVYPMVYPDIVRSQAFLTELFDMKVTVNDRKETLETDLYDYLLNYQKSSPLGLLASVPGKIAGMFSKDGDGTEQDSTVDPFHLTKEQGSVARMLGKMIKAEVDKKTMSITITVSMQDPEICALTAVAVSDNLRKYVTEYRTEKAVKDCEYYEKLYLDAQNAYYDALRAYSVYSDSHQAMSLKSNKIETERLKNEAELQYGLYNSTAQQLQLAQAKVQQETPVFAQLIPPAVPLKSANSRKKMALAFGLLGAMAGAAYVLFKNRDQDVDTVKA